MKQLNTDKSIRRFQTAGYLSVVVMVGVFGTWSAVTTLNGAVIAPAVIIVESNTKRIQHKEGGIVRKIMVNDGDRVKSGQDLVILDDTEARAELGIVDGILVENLARRARLEAQRDDAATVEFLDELLARQNEPDVAKVMAGQKRLFESRRAAVNGKKDQLLQQIDELTKQVTGVDSQITANDRQVELIKRELEGLQKLLDKGLVPLSRVLAMRREQARLEGNRGELIAGKAGAASRIGEIRLAILQVDDESRTQSLTDLRDAEARVAEMQERKLAIADKLSRTTIRAPISGDVYQLALHTIGGVISPAETLMLIVPDADELILQAQVQPQNIDKVEVGQKANIRFPSFSARMTPELGAEVTQVSADTSRMAVDSPPFYSLRLRIPASELAKLEGKKLKPGMPAEAFIQTAAQTPLSYFLRPFTDQVAHMMREP